jgi:uncharacterized damage-inducible protein DinB
MEMKDFILAQLEREVATSRKVLERVPEGKNDWKPHEKSMALGYLAAVVASMPGWVSLMVEKDQVNFGDPSSERFRPRVAESRAELLKVLEDGAADARRVLTNTTDDHLMKPWRFMMNGQTISEDPRHVVLSNALLSHLAHHRGQLSVYLRLTEATVPAMYGPSADEQF